MICNSCGASSDNNKLCDYCGAAVVIKDLTHVLKSVDSDRAKTLELTEELSYIFSDEDDTEQVLTRIFEKSSVHIENSSLKKAEFLSRLALIESESDDRAKVLSARVKLLYAAKLTGSIQSANIKQKYLLDAKTLLNKVQSHDVEGDKKELTELLESLEGTKASHYTNMGLDPQEQIAAQSWDGCFTIIGIIFAALIIIGIFV